MNEQGYLNLLNNILLNGSKKSDRTGTGTLSIFSPDPLRFDLSDNTIPLLTSKYVPFKAVLKELLWFLRGETDSKILEEEGVNIWKANSSVAFLQSRNLDYPRGILGPLYGYQWRNFGGVYPNKSDGFDQILYIENLLKNDPDSRRIFLSAWNPKDIDKMAITPCHVSVQFYVQNGQVSCHMYQRSVDMFLGLPFNIASYATLLHIYAKKCGLKAKYLVISMGDAHIYTNHLDQVDIQLKRQPLYKLPTLKICDSVIEKSWNNISIQDFTVLDYKRHPVIKADMAI